MMNTQEQNLLFHQVVSGDDSKLERLMNSYQGLIVSCVHKYIPEHASSRNADLYQELLSAGQFGLLKAIRDFNPEKSNSDSHTHYLYIRINQEIYMAFNNSKHALSYSGYQLRAKHQLKKEISLLQNDLNREPSIDELANKLGWSPQRVKNGLQELTYKPTILDDDLTTDPDSNGNEQDIHDSIHSAMNKLNAKERMVLFLVYGFDKTGRARSTQEASKLLNVSQQHISKVSQDARQKMASMIQDNLK
ncbi:sigma-70 family RNA polymerase sigma factor [Fructobacillus sp. EFB-N1]|uniref:sigma-70 family RNA polymerase sigma factor n=1 Tax=Fructobacillus sp. EFB-N1 TaxID=1658766 RepID=UPI00064DC432|nr:sigma-70 family RNA polymerase sigma factor [Fructobacillus sp. EFB-N1]